MLKQFQGDRAFGGARLQPPLLSSAVLRRAGPPASLVCSTKNRLVHALGCAGSPPCARPRKPSVSGGLAMPPPPPSEGGAEKAPPWVRMFLKPAIRTWKQGQRRQKPRLRNPRRPLCAGEGGRGRTQQLCQGDSPDPSLLAFYALGEATRPARVQPGSPESQVFSRLPAAEDASLAAGARVRRWQAAARAGGRGVCVCVWVLALPLQARARLPPEFLSGSSDSRGKLNILSQGRGELR